ncbi:hypothetical protein QFW82_23550 [Streptomyces malaysiensis subsp. malaysiensis]|uniref:hypothetical protein n=1 Tax=Streptomyces malaysiensis TaxID=92644 RepID=UPI0024C0A3A7|nr:hypothetical protein [Streptomyces sp. NA07423]WHX19807.1 hypothetical protein QFW82_23550 [Streptomyces sp. NA07423]
MFGLSAPPPATDHLTTIIGLWPDLEDALAARQQTEWPPVMGLARILLDDDARAEQAAERLDTSAEAPGARPVPISIDALDTMRDVAARLVYLADVIAAEIQLPPMAPAPRGGGWTPEEIARRDQLAAEDAADPRRWTWPTRAEDSAGHRSRPVPARQPLARTAIGASAWLAARLEARPGPFLPLGPSRIADIAAVAADCVYRVETALRIARRAAVVSWPCPACRGQLELHGGDGQPPTMACTDCGRSWHSGAVA